MTRLRIQADRVIDGRAAQPLIGYAVDIRCLNDVVMVMRAGQVVSR